MNEDQDLLTRKLKLWYKVNEPRPSPVPEVSSDKLLPEVEIDESRINREVAGGLRNLRVFSDDQWQSTCLWLSALVTDMHEVPRKRLLDSLTVISGPPPVDPALVEKWIKAISTLQPSTYTAAVMEFFQVAWMWGQLEPVTEMGLENVLRLFYEAFKNVQEGARSSAMMHFLVKMAGRRPERFCYWLKRTAEDGKSVIHGLKKAETLIPEAKSYAVETLLDFGAEMGWEFLEEEDAPLWEAVARNGELFYRRIRGFAASASSMRLLSGVLAQLAEEEDLEDLLTTTAVEVVSEKFGDFDKSTVKEVLAELPDIRDALISSAEIEMAVDVLSLRGFMTKPRETGRALVKIALVGAKGRDKLRRVGELLRSFQGNINESLVDTMLEITTEVGAEKTLPVAFWLRLGELGERVFGAGGVSKTMRNTVLRVLANMADSRNPEACVSYLEEAMARGESSAREVFRAASFMLRAEESMDPAEVLPMIPAAGSVFSLVDEEYRDKLLGGLPPAWFVTLMKADERPMQMVADALGKIADEKRRGRFLEMLVPPLLEEMDPSDPTFEEYLAASVAQYNKAAAIPKTREIERDLLGKLFRTGDRSRAAETAVSGLKGIPGFEGRRASDLLERARVLCEAFNKQAVWETGSDAVYSRFLRTGLQSLIRALVNRPEAIDQLSEERLKRLLNILMPSDIDSADHKTASWQIETGAAFFGKVLPLVVEITARQPELLPPLMERISRAATRASQGVPAGKDFLDEVAVRLEQHLIEECTSRLQAMFSESAPVPIRVNEEWLEDLFKVWNQSRKQEIALMKEARRTARILTSDQQTEQIFLHQSNQLAVGMCRAGMLSPSRFVKPDRVSELQRLRKSVAGADVMEVFRSYEHGGEVLEVEQLVGSERFFDQLEDTAGENPCRYWRHMVFSTFCNCVIDLTLISGNKPARVRELIDGFLEVAEFLGTETGGENLLKALERALTVKQGREAAESPPEVERSLERHLFRPLWRRRAMSRVELLIAGMEEREELVDRLLERLALERGVAAEVRFLRRFGLLFLAIEEAIVRQDDRQVDIHMHDALQSTWLFNPDVEQPDSNVETAMEAYETAAEQLRQIRVRAGVVTAKEAEEISAEMRQRYRDNADSVAILLRWTMDPSRQNLLKILEQQQNLLEAASKDTELLNLIDVLADKEVNLEQTVSAFSGNIEELKGRLKKMISG
ncbi:hypothetical protein GF402_03140 [Candidatus Fermentibacteria bacterium]|nr:hypothetical protein [Candidatus Fermentibacteria bacterium]